MVIDTVSEYECVRMAKGSKKALHLNRYAMYSFM